MCTCIGNEVNPELVLPNENIFIATEFKLVEDAIASEYPVMVDQCDHYKLWYKPDTVYESYKGNLPTVIIWCADNISFSAWSCIECSLDWPAI